MPRCSPPRSRCVRARLAPAFVAALIAGLYLAAVASQANTIFPAPDMLGDAATNGPFWITPALLAAIAALAIFGPRADKAAEGHDGR